MSDADTTQAQQDVVANVDEIIEHVINANMSSMPYEVYSELFDAVDGLGAEIENLQAENDKLREQVTQLRDDWESERDYADQMEAKEKRAVAENAKLRQLAKAAWGCVKRRVSCDECRMVCWGCTLQSAMCELGIEVEDA